MAKKCIIGCNLIFVYPHHTPEDFTQEISCRMLSRRFVAPYDVLKPFKTCQRGICEKGVECHPFMLESSRIEKNNIPGSKPKISLTLYVDSIIMEKWAVVQSAGIAAGRRNKQCFRCYSLVPSPFYVCRGLRSLGNV